MLTVRQDQMNSFRKANNAPPVQPCEPDWVEIRLTDKWNEPVPNAVYEITLPDGTVISGNLDKQGSARFDNIQSGNCKAQFPELYEPDPNPDW